MKKFKIYLPKKKNPIAISTKLRGERADKKIIDSFPKGENGIAEIEISGIKTRILARMGTSDIFVFRQIFIDGDYSFPVPINPRFVIDCGANVGYAAVYFANRFPAADILAVEPEDSNFKIMRLNTKNYPRIKLLKAGIWNRNVNLEIDDTQSKSTGHWAVMVKESVRKTKKSIRAVNIYDLLKKSGHDKIDILKIDVEGAEKKIFSSDYANWLGRVRILIIELHDRYKEGCDKAFYSAIRKYPFKKSRKGENIILINQEKIR